MSGQKEVMREGDLLQFLCNDIEINDPSVLTYSCVIPESPLNEKLTHDDADLLYLLREFCLETLFNDLKNSGITFRSLKYLSKEDISEAIQNIGFRAEFREKLFFWHKSKFGIEDETLSQTSKVFNWLQKPCQDDSPCSSINSLNRVGLQPLSQILSETPTGRQIIKDYQENSCISIESCIHNSYKKFSCFFKFLSKIPKRFSPPFDIETFHQADLKLRNIFH